MKYLKRISKKMAVAVALFLILCSGLTTWFCLNNKAIKFKADTNASENHDMLTDFAWRNEPLNVDLNATISEDNKAWLKVTQPDDISNIQREQLENINYSETSSAINDAYPNEIAGGFRNMFINLGDSFIPWNPMEGIENQLRYVPGQDNHYTFFYEFSTDYRRIYLEVHKIITKGADGKYAITDLPNQKKVVAIPYRAKPMNNVSFFIQTSQYGSALHVLPEFHSYLGETYGVQKTNLADYIFFLKNNLNGKSVFQMNTSSYSLDNIATLLDMPDNADTTLTITGKMTWFVENPSFSDSWSVPITIHRSGKNYSLIESDYVRLAGHFSNFLQYYVTKYDQPSDEVLSSVTAFTNDQSVSIANGGTSIDLSMFSNLKKNCYCPTGRRNNYGFTEGTYYTIKNDQYPDQDKEYELSMNCDANSTERFIFKTLDPYDNTQKYIFIKPEAENNITITVHYVYRNYSETEDVNFKVTNHNNKNTIDYTPSILTPQVLNTKNKTFKTTFSVKIQKQNNYNKYLVNNLEQVPSINNSEATFNINNLIIGNNSTKIDVQDSSGKRKTISYTITRCKQGDSNCDGKIDPTDLSIFASKWQQADPNTNYVADYNEDTKVDPTDLSIFAANWGK